MTNKLTIQETVQEHVNESLERFISIHHDNASFQVLPDEEDLPHVLSARYDTDRDAFVITFSADPHNVQNVDDLIKVFISLDNKAISGFEFSQMKHSKRGFAPTLINRLRELIARDRHNVSEAIRENIKVNLAQDVLRGKLDKDLELVAG